MKTVLRIAVLAGIAAVVLQPRLALQVLDWLVSTSGRLLGEYAFQALK